MQLISGCSFNEAFPPLPVVSWLYYLVPRTLWLCAPLQQMFTKEAESFLWPGVHTVPTNEAFTSHLCDHRIIGRWELTCQ